MKYILVIVGLIAIAATGEAIQCYLCMKPGVEKCADPFDKSKDGLKATNFTVPCLCRKTIADTSNGTVTARDCVVPSVGVPVSLGSGANFTIKSMEMHFCNTDLCNGASTYTGALSTLMGVATLLVFSNWN